MYASVAGAGGETKDTAAKTLPELDPRRANRFQLAGSSTALAESIAIGAVPAAKRYTPMLVLTRHFEVS